MQAVISIFPNSNSLNHLLQRAHGSFSTEQMIHDYSSQMYHLRRINSRFPLQGKTVLEIGPGWHLVTALLFHLFGVKRMYLIDIEPKLDYKLCMQYLGVVSTRITDFDLPDQVANRLSALKKASSLNQLLTMMRADYIAPGDARKTNIRTGSVDLVYSYGVIEHIPEDIIPEIFRECGRILNSNGRHYHNIGLHDHFEYMGSGNGVNFLRYSNAAWNVIAGNSIAYHNRLRKPYYLELLDQLGAKITYREEELLKKNLDALCTLKVSNEFAGYTLEELACTELVVEFTIE